MSVTTVPRDGETTWLTESRTVEVPTYKAMALDEGSVLSVGKGSIQHPGFEGRSVAIWIQGGFEGQCAMLTPAEAQVFARLIITVAQMAEAGQVMQ
jgi:hypothetical protein